MKVAIYETVDGKIILANESFLPASGETKLRGFTDFPIGKTPIDLGYERSCGTCNRGRNER